MCPTSTTLPFGASSGALFPFTSALPSADTDYISLEELAKVEQMLNHLSEESKQAAASTLVSPIHPAPAQSRHQQPCGVEVGEPVMSAQDW